MSIVVFTSSAVNELSLVPVRLKIVISSPAEVPVMVMMPPVGFGYAFKEASSTTSIPVFASTITGKSIVLDP